MHAILFDSTKCKGCERCVDACVEANGTDPVKAERDRALTRDGLSANRRVTLLPVDEGRFTRLSCMHCLEPSCVSACLVGGLSKTADGPVVYDPDKCIGCRYCMLACPFHVPRYEWDRTAPLMAKCSMCFERLGQGKLPACVEACPNEAMLFGERDELLSRAHELIRRNPDRYLPRVWGEAEFGGTSVLFLSDVDLTAAGWPAGATASIPSLTEPLIHKTPVIGLTVALGCWGLGAIIQRRNKLMGSRSELDRDGTSEDRGNDD
jgi:Fe-S-cluster-containing dehydrogenase component